MRLGQVVSSGGRSPKSNMITHLKRKD